MTAACPGQCHALLVSAVTRGLLPLAGAPPDDPARRALEFYAHGYLKERVAFRLVAGLGVRSPCALSRIHAAVLSGRDAAGAALLAGVLPAGDAPGRVLVAAAAECHLRVLACGLGPGDRALLTALEAALLAVLFVAGAEELARAQTLGGADWDAE